MQNNVVIDPEWGWNIKAWMIQDLGLSGLSLNLYAIIYGYRKDGWKVLERTFLAKLTGASVEGVRRALKKLQKRNLIQTCTISSARGERTAFMVDSPPGKKKPSRKASKKQQVCPTPALSKQAMNSTQKVSEIPTKTGQMSESDQQQSWGVPPNKVGGYIKSNSKNNIHPEHLPSCRSMPRHAEGWTELSDMKRAAINRNLLARADAPFMALIDLGYSPNEIKIAWKTHQQELAECGRQARYFTALWKFLGADDPENSAARQVMDKARAVCAEQKTQHEKRMNKQTEQAKEARIDEILSKSPEYQQLARERQKYHRQAIFDADARAHFEEICISISKLRTEVCASLFGTSQMGACNAA